MALAVEKSQPVVSAPEKEIEDSNIGSKLLASMGWTSGSGLGSSAAGRAAPVQAKAFASGAGIGASQGGSMAARFLCINLTEPFVSTRRQCHREGQ